MDNLKVYQAAMYVRLSKEDADVGTAKAASDSIQNQKLLIRDYVKGKEDIEIIREYEDDGYTGSDFDRPGFQSMMDDVRRGIIDCIIVKDLSRFGREYIDSGKYIERLFPTLGIRFIAINDNIDRKKGDQDDIVVPFKNLMNDAYCRDISIKIRSNLEAKRKNGQYIGAFTPYGYLKDENDKNRLVVDPYAAGVVKDIFKMKLNGMSQAGIAGYLNDHGVLSPLEYKHSIGIHLQDNFKVNDQAKWDSVSVRRILQNEVYTGTLVQGKHKRPNHKIKKIVERPESEWVRIENSHEEIISRHEFDLVQRILSFDTRLPANGDTVYPLSGIAVCAECGSPMTKKDVPAGGRVYSYYICPNHANKRGCSSTHRIPKGKLEDTVFELLQEHIQAVLDMKRILEYIDDVPFKDIEVRRLNGRKDRLEEEIEHWKELRDRLYEDLKDGVISMKDYEELRERFSKKRNDAEKEMLSVKTRLKDVLADNTDKYHWMTYFAEHKDIKELTRAVAVELVQQVRVFDKKNIEVTFSFDDSFGAYAEMIKTNAVSGSNIYAIADRTGAACEVRERQVM